MSRLAQIIHLTLWGALAALLTLPIIFAPVMRQQPRLVGYGCEGASGAIYRNEEDEFPPCKAIERNEP